MTGFGEGLTMLIAIFLLAFYYFAYKAKNPQNVKRRHRSTPTTRTELDLQQLQERG